MSCHVKAVRVLLIVLIAMCFAMVTLGGYVRLSGSGFSIPEWPVFTVAMKETAPGTFEKVKSVIPPSDEAGWTTLRDTYVRAEPVAAGIAVSEFKRIFWIEWSHRALGATVGIVFLAYLLTVLLSRELRGLIGKHAVGAFLLLIAQAVLGGIVVLFELDAEKVAIHLLMAFLLTSLLLWTLLRLVHPPIPAGERAGKNPILRWAIAVYTLICIQIFSGGLMAATQAGYQLNTWPKMGDYWVPTGMVVAGDGLIKSFFENEILIQFFHRWYAIFVAVAILFFIFRCMTVRVSRVARWALRLLFAVVTLQICLGIITMLTHIHLHVALTHQMIGLVLLLVSLVTVYETACHKVVAEEALAEEMESRTDSARKAQVHA